MIESSRARAVATSSAPLDPPDPPANARIAPFIPYQALMPLISAMVTNGGYGGVQMALAAGVPLVVAGGSEEKPEIAARVQWSGAGIDLRTGRPKPARIRAAVRRGLDEPGVCDRARAVARLTALSAADPANALLRAELARAAIAAR